MLSAPSKTIELNTQKSKIGMIKKFHKNWLKPDFFFNNTIKWKLFCSWNYLFSAPQINEDQELIPSQQKLNTRTSLKKIELPKFDYLLGGKKNQTMPSLSIEL